ncbi:LVIVD repeat-containing protein [Haloprofundus sp. MHR1]|uniref:LVIVD repeat-containing protein n=1 Tax=Haloprofundus sp. MHR1 TaxID=2572921 RepID=UPI0010BE3DD1|nr:hypothetical protein [Haloprofundus sp. MHR1]QCJ47189.1 hypothetical protein FCF25_08695 [Haloprofundus sp. MHR1]
MRRRDVLRGSAAALGLSAAPALTTSRADAHPGPYRPYGFVDVRGAKEAVVAPDGQTAFVAASGGYAVVDVSVADRPELLAERRGLLSDREGGPLRQVWDVKHDAANERLLAVGPANSIPGALSGLLVEDVSDPREPETLAFFETDYPIHNCYVSGGYAYLTANEYDRNPLVVVDLRGDDPREVGRWSLLDEDAAWGDVSAGRRTVHDVWVQDGVAYLAHWDAGTWLLDVSDPTSPETIGPLEGASPSELAVSGGQSARRESTVPPGNDHYVATNEDGTLLGVGKESWAERAGEGDGDDELVGGPGGVELWDVADPQSPQKLSTIDPPPTPDPTYGGVWTTAHNFELRDDRLYTSWYRGGVKRHDVTDPRNPEELAWWREPERASFWTARLAVPGETFVASSMGTDDATGRLYVFPDHAGQQTNPPSLGGSQSDGVDVLTPTPNPESRAGASDSGTPASAGDSDGDADGSSAIVAPGFGVGTAVTALGVGAWWSKRQTGVAGASDRGRRSE